MNMWWLIPGLIAMALDVGFNNGYAIDNYLNIIVMMLMFIAGAVGVDRNKDVDQVEGEK